MVKYSIFSVGSCHTVPEIYNNGSRVMKTVRMKNHDFMQRIEGNKAENSSAYVRETGRKRKETDYLLTSDLEVCNPLRREFFDPF